MLIFVLDSGDRRLTIRFTWGGEVVVWLNFRPKHTK